MTTWTRGVCSANGIDIHYLRTGGEKPPVVLLHELMGDGACWTLLARAARIENAGHGLPFERPDNLAQVVSSFLRALAS